MTGVEFILLLACVAIIVLFVKASNAKDTIRNLAAEVVLLRDKPKADKLIAEYKELGGDDNMRVGVSDYGKPEIEITRRSKATNRCVNWYTLATFEHELLCPLRKQRLEKLDKKPRKKK